MTKTQVVTVLGGGSVWTPQLLKLLGDTPEASSFEIRLFGSTAKHLNEVERFASRIGTRRLTVSTSIHLDQALADASIILNQTRIGGWHQRRLDESIPVELGAVGDESVGLGGVRSAARAWPFIASCADAIVRNAPQAWLLNLSNPSDLVSRAWRFAGCSRIISLCDHPQNLARVYAKAANATARESRLSFLGMTHVGWHVAPDQFPLSEFLQANPQLRSWVNAWDAIPTDWRVRLSHSEDLVHQQRRNPGQRAKVVSTLVDQIRAAIAMSDSEQYTSLVSNRSPRWYSTMVVPAIRALLGGPPAKLVIGFPNDGQLSALADEVQIEGSASICEAGVQVEPLPSHDACRRDVVEFGHTRNLAFEAMVDPKLNTFRSFAQADPFTPANMQDVDLQKLLDKTSNETSTRRNAAG